MCVKCPKNERLKEESFVDLFDQYKLIIQTILTLYIHFLIIEKPFVLVLFDAGVIKYQKV